MSYIICPKCKESNPESTMYCSCCGESLRGAKRVETSTKAYVKSSDIILEKAQAGEFHCGVFEKRNGVFDGAEQFKEYLNYLYGNQGKTVYLKKDGVSIGNLLVWRGKIAGAVGSANQNMSLTSFLLTSATTQTIKVMVPWKEIKAVLRRPDNHICLFFNHAAKKRLEWVDLRIGTEISTGVQFGTEPELESKIADVFMEKCKAKGITIPVLA
jgi:hypothetical protein